MYTIHKYFLQKSWNSFPNYFYQLPSSFYLEQHTLVIDLAVFSEIRQLGEELLLIITFFVRDEVSESTCSSEKITRFTIKRMAFNARRLNQHVRTS